MKYDDDFDHGEVDDNGDGRSVLCRRQVLFGLVPGSAVLS
jgi:hypothetical protein